MSVFTVISSQLVDDYACLQTLTPNGFSVGDTIVIAGVGAPFNATAVVRSVEPLPYLGVSSEGDLLFAETGTGSSLTAQLATIPAVQPNARLNQVLYACVGTDAGRTAAAGTITKTITCTWTTSALVVAALGIDPATANDTAYVTTAVNAANAWAFRRRQQAGYTDAPGTSPGGDVQLGVTLYAETLYRERGSVDSFQSFNSMDMGATAPGATMGQINKLLGIPRSSVA